jgi:hypothetical protein
LNLSRAPRSRAWLGERNDDDKIEDGNVRVRVVDSPNKKVWDLSWRGLLLLDELELDDDDGDDDDDDDDD